MLGLSIMGVKRIVPAKRYIYFIFSAMKHFITALVFNARKQLTLRKDPGKIRGLSRITVGWFNPIKNKR
jgi:hypothetical protein